MKSKSNSMFSLLILIVVTVAIAGLSYYGIGIGSSNENKSELSPTADSNVDPAADGEEQNGTELEIEGTGVKVESSSDEKTENTEINETENSNEDAEKNNGTSEELPVESNKILGIGNIKLGLDLSGGVYIVYEADKPDVTEDEMKSAVSLIQGRLDRKGYTEAEAAQLGSNRIRVDIPGIGNAEDAINEIGQTAQLTFMDMSGQTVLTGADVANAKKLVGSSERGGVAEPYVSLEFTPEGKEKFSKATADNIGKQIAIVLDNSVISAPTVQAVINDGSAMISGNFTAESAEELAALIRAGSLPFNLKVIEMNNIGARLGADALQTGIYAGIVGIILVLIFMIAIYKVSGIAADWALIIYVGLEMLALSAFGVTLTLPGIAGIVLSVGMAVDANVIIFERIKEELLMGKTLRSALDAGFSRAFPAILDGNITTLIAAVVLFWLGNGTIKGFAQTLMIGIVISMFTALVITKLIMKCLVGVGLNNPKLYGIKLN